MAVKLEAMLRNMLLSRLNPWPRMTVDGVFFSSSTEAFGAKSGVRLILRDPPLILAHPYVPYDGKPPQSDIEWRTGNHLRAMRDTYDLNMIWCPETIPEKYCTFAAAQGSLIVQSMCLFGSEYKDYVISYIAEAISMHQKYGTPIVPIVASMMRMGNAYSTDIGSILVGAFPDDEIVVSAVVHTRLLRPGPL